MKTKAFSSKLHKENSVAEDAVLQYLQREVNPLYRKNEDKMGVDIVGPTNVEVERRPEWNGFAYPYPTVHIPYRKHKWLSLPTFEYFQVNKDLTVALRFTKEDILKHLAVVENPNKYVQSGEYFIDLPVGISTIISL